LIIFRFDEQLFFANAPNFRDAVLAAVAADSSVCYVLVDAESINEIDVTGLDMLAELQDELAQAKVELRFARMKAHIREYMRRANLEDAIGVEHFYPSVQAGVDAYLAEQALSSETDVL
jgi:MFS superfamily sulfate permease-like transporter